MLAHLRCLHGREDETSGIKRGCDDRAQRLCGCGLAGASVTVERGDRACVGGWVRRGGGTKKDLEWRAVSTGQWRGLGLRSTWIRRSVVRC
ncbi:hypothetical protein F443_06175 [Phytophthora nicotianae P1569]|uniref:Uncharacterized protein n=2 Tax=Phytophthora nicotianae TaxID=4792 RepID=V9FGK3_PHYNI|nr:hypothetical protein F443_06175 [Phytophthora nicotianae P1569]ETO78940.1 hypothetical protein F444_06236 [Phytophthora nicotianae P1976]